MLNIIQIISGQVSPPLEGVTIRIIGKDEETPIHTLVTQKDGTYSIGPLDGKIKYRYVDNNFFYYNYIKLIMYYCY